LLMPAMASCAERRAPSMQARRVPLLMLCYEFMDHSGLLLICLLPVGGMRDAMSLATISSPIQPSLA
jgi:hypothetical protein